MKSLRLLILLSLVATPGCYATKLVSVPMRVVGALGSAVPVVGNTTHDVIDEAAEIVDELPF
ncbi:MAG: DUF6726 family protein [Myxococcota bacterium]